ncbi:MAG: hypothetical protein IT167_05710 [Bryobacterales bacterium]|nr:hypothetical protein [Bryobacterales bacterium]
MDSPLTQLLSRADLAGHVIGYDETRRWPAAEREAILRLGILRKATDAEYASCEICADGEPCDLILDISPDLRIHCPQHGLVRIAGQRLQQWELDFEKLGALLIGQLGLTGRRQTIAAGRVWQLGRRQVSGRTAEFFPVQGIAWPDSLDVLRAAPKLAGSPAPIIVCPDQLPLDAAWRESGRVFLRLSEWARIHDGHLVVDFETYADLYRQTAEAFEKPLTPTPPERRERLIEEFCRTHLCKVKQVYTWAAVDRGDLNRWKNGDPTIPDSGEPAKRIERLLQLDHRSRA